MTNEAKRIAKNRLLKRIGLIGLITSGAIVLVFFILSLLPQGSAAFTIRIDNPGSTANSNFKMFANVSDAEEGKSSISYMRGEPANSVATTDVQHVMSYLSSIDEFKGQQTYYDEDKTHELAMVYTVYLQNTSEEESLTINYAVNLDAYKQPDNTSAAPIEFFRILIQTELNGDVSNRFYGQSRTSYLEVPTDCEDQTREPISWGKDRDENNELYIKSVYQSNGNDGYCNNFQDHDLAKDIVSYQVVIPAGKTMRFTYCAYFAGDDLDSGGYPPENAYMLLSLHFGI